MARRYPSAMRVPRNIPGTHGIMEKSEMQTPLDGIVKTLKENRYGFITPSDKLPPPFVEKDVYFGLKVVCHGEIPQIGESVTFLLFTNKPNSHENPSARIVWRDTSSSMSRLRTFGSTQSLDRGESNINTRKNNLCELSSDLDQSQRNSVSSDTWYQGTIVRKGLQLCIKPINNVSKLILTFAFQNVHGRRVNEDDRVRFKVDDDMHVLVVCAQEENTQDIHKDEESEDDTEEPHIRRFKPSTNSSVTTEFADEESSLWEHNIFVGSRQLLGVIVRIRDNWGLLKPEQPLPQCFGKGEYVYFNPGHARSAGVALQRGDMIGFTLSSKDRERPKALNMAVVKFRRRSESELNQIMLGIEKCLGQAFTECKVSDDEALINYGDDFGNDEMEGEQEGEQEEEQEEGQEQEQNKSPVDVNTKRKPKTVGLVDFVSCVPLWHCLGNRQHADDGTIHRILQLVLKLHMEIRGMKQAFKMVLNTLMESPLCNPWSSPLKDCIKRCSDEDNSEMHSTFQEFFLLVFRYSTEKSRSAVSLIKGMMCTFQGKERFFFDSLRAISKCTSNNSCDLQWDDIPLIPSTDELLNKPDNDYLSLMPVSDKYQSVEEYFDTYFRLLRADCFDSLRKGIHDLLRGCLDPRDMNVYIHVAFAGVHLKKIDTGLEVVLKVTPQRDVKNWQTCSNLMFGNLLCISPSGDFKDVIWATVSNRDPALLKKDQLIMVELCSVCNRMSDSDAVVLFAYSSGNMVMVESPTYYRAYQPILKALQSANVDEMPFQEELVLGTECGTESPPQYIPELDTLNQVKLKAASTLDEYQSIAWDHIFQHRVACVQGPPGTGKTYIGIKIVESIVSFDSCPKSPILVLTYKNHALDEFLKGLLKCMSTDLVRVGSRSNDKELDKFNLNELAKVVPKEYSLIKLIMKTKDELSSLQSVLQSTLNELARSKYLQQDTLINFLQPNQLFSLIEGNQKIFHRQARNIISKTCQTLHENKNDMKARNQLALAFRCWCPQEKFIQEVENTYVNLMDVNISTRANKDQPSDSLDIFDEKDIDDLQRERMSGISQKTITGKSMTYFSEKSDLIPEVKLFSISNAFVSRIPMLKLMNVDDVWSLTASDRIKLLQCLLIQQAQKASDHFNKELVRYQRLCEKKNELENQHKINVLHSQKVIGMTITGASINHNLLSQVKPAIVIVEEAAEILEAQLIPTLGPWVKHLILIGDHMQLRPQVESYTLVTKYHFDVSMMERLIRNNLPYVSLYLQNRMKPEFAILLKDIYPELESNLTRVATHCKLDCMEKSMYFWEHTDPETASRSYSNEMEANKAIQLATYMVLQGVPPSTITIIAPYQGQVGLLRRKARKAEQQWVEFFTAHCIDGDDEDVKQKRISVHTIDMFQGDENDVIIISLVRSNDSGQVGFLKTLNRRCVAQSRSKCGMYFIGNASTLVHNKHWKVLHDAMSQQQCTGDSISFICSKHPSTTVSATSADDVPLDMSFCEVTCDEELKCKKHRCKKPCQPRHQHNRCTTTCLQLMICGMHLCLKDCYPSHSHDMCGETINYNHSGCGHEQTKLCTEPEPQCIKTVSFEFPCKHMGERKCFQDQSKLKCRHDCTKVLICGHLCSKRCSDQCDQNDCGTCIKLRKQEELKKLEFEAQQIKLAKLRAQEELDEMSKETDVIKVEEIANDAESAAEFNKVIQFVQRSFPTPVDHEVIVEKVTKIVHIQAKKSWLKKMTELFDPQQHDWKFLKKVTADIKTIAQKDFKIEVTKGTYGQGVYTSSNIHDVGIDDTSWQDLSALVVDVLLGRHKVVSQSPAEHVFLTSLNQMKCDSIYNPGVAMANRYVADEIAVASPKAVLPLYLVDYKIRGSESHQNILETKALASGDNKVIKYSIKASREVDPSDPLQQEFRTVESQFHRLLAFQDKNKNKNARMKLEKYEVKSVDYFINPPLLRKFAAKEKEMMEKYGDAKESKRILAFHGTKKEKTKSIVEDNFILERLAESSGDKGFYGAGIYLTEFPQTGVFYGEALILCKALPGRSFDIDPHHVMMGGDLQPGYDSHRVNTQGEGYGEEIVIFDPDQVLPCYVINFVKIAITHQPPGSKKKKGKKKKTKYMSFDQMKY